MICLHCGMPITTALWSPTGWTHRGEATGIRCRGFKVGVAEPAEDQDQNDSLADPTLPATLPDPSLYNGTVYGIADPG